ncbi:hypothetical protein CDD82_2001 [Ophiocordyceps australis]|uniref:Uncharacterized protein n=1 Tax=Ophiocordyceps australis TaxID=1399860 RepID=A0A2C5Y1C6_9HYPO|nr:hypothetical protein CDD82_2001 [Ophiocordyceps australis]
MVPRLLLPRALFRQPLPRHAQSFWSRSKELSIEQEPKLELEQRQISAYLAGKGELFCPSVICSLMDDIYMSASGDHNAALIVATPAFAQSLQMAQDAVRCASLLSEKQKADRFHLLLAVVDNVMPPRSTPESVSGISIVRGRLDHLLPGLWTQPSPLASDDANAVSALTLNVGGLDMTLPLARMPVGGKSSLLKAVEVDLSKPVATVVRALDKTWSRVALRLDQAAPSMQGYQFWTPLVPMTKPRPVAEAMGNIVRQVDIDGRAEPASQELEAVVHDMLKHASRPHPVAIWALLTRPEHEAQKTAPEPDASLPTRPQASAMRRWCAYIEQALCAGGRLHGVLSGGGGWGAKRGLLALDGQVRHFTSRQDDMTLDQLYSAIQGSSFAPPGWHIQFFMLAPGIHDKQAMSEMEFALGASREAALGAELDMGHGQGHGGQGTRHMVQLPGFFGAQSTQGIYVAGGAGKDGLEGWETKLSAPGSYMGSKCKTTDKA